MLLAESTHAPASRKIQKKTVGARGGLIKGAAVDKGKAAGHQGESFTIARLFRIWFA